MSAPVASRALARLLMTSKDAGLRYFKSSAAPSGSYEYMHGKQFNIPAEKNRALIYGGGYSLLVVSGLGIPVFAVWYQMKKAAGA